MKEWHTGSFTESHDGGVVAIANSRGVGLACHNTSPTPGPGLWEKPEESSQWVEERRRRRRRGRGRENEHEQWREEEEEEKKKKKERCCRHIFPAIFFFPLQPRPRNVTIPITTAITAAAYVAAAEVDHLHPIRRDIRLKNKETISAIRKIA